MTNNKKQITTLEFIPQIKVDCEGEYSLSEIEEGLRDDRCFFPSNWRMTNEIIGKINRYPQIYDSEFDMDDRYTEDDKRVYVHNDKIYKNYQMVLPDNLHFLYQYIETQLFKNIIGRTVETMSI